MAGIAALGAAVGGLAKGYMEGEKHRSDLEDAEARRGLMKLQAEEAGLKISKARREEDYEAGRQKIMEEALAAADQPAPVQPGIAANPVAASGEAPAQPAGLAGPGGTPGQPAAPAAPKVGAVPAQGGAPASANLARMESVIARLQDYDLKRGKIDPIQAMEGMKKFRMYQQEGVIDGMRYFEQTGDTNGAIERINATGRYKMPEGTTFTTKREEMVPGSGVMVNNVYAVSPDGKTSINYRDLLRSSLSPEKALSYESETGVKLAELALKKTAEENLNNYRTEHNRITAAHYANQDRLAEQQRLAYAEQTKDLKAAQAMKTRLQASDTAFDTILQSNGVSKEMTADKLSMLEPSQQQAYRAGLNASVAAHTLWKMNLGADGKEGISTTEAMQIVKNAAKIDINSLKRDEDGGYYMQLGKKRVAVPGIFAGEQPAPAPGAQPAAQQRPGVRGPQAAPAAPRPVDADGMPVPQAPTTLSRGYSTPDARGLLRTPQYGAGMQTFAPQD